MLIGTLTRIRIGVRLLLAFGLLLCVTLALGVVCFAGMRRFSEKSLRLIDFHSRMSEQAVRLGYLNNELRRFEKDLFINVASPQETRRHLMRWESAREEVHRQLQETCGLARTPQEREQCRQIAATFDWYFAGFESVAAPLTIAAPRGLGTRRPTAAEANRLMSPYKVFTHRVDALCASFALHEKQVIEQGRRDLVEAQGAITLLIVLTTGGGLLLGMALTVAFTRSVTRPLAELADSAQRIAHGDLGVTIAPTSRDEVGLLASALRFMVGRLRRTIDALEEEVTEHQMARDALQEQAAHLEEEIAERQAAQAELALRQEELEDLNRTLGQRVEATVAQLRKHEENYRLLLDSAPEAIYGIDVEGNCTFCNAACLKLLGYQSQEELLGRNMHQVMHHSHADGSPYPAEECPVTVAMSRGQELQVDSEVLWRADGSFFPAEFRSHPQRRDGEVVGGVVSFVDVTERKRAAGELKLAKEAADAASRSKSEFLANMSHEIRTPLNAVIGYSTLALETELSARQHDYLLKIADAGTQLLRIVNDILDFSKVEAGMLEMESIPFRLDDVLFSVTALVQPKAVDKRVEIILNTGHDLPPILKGDPLRLGQVLTNLMGNAVKFTRQGEVELAIAVAERHEKRVRLAFAVRDTGIGLTGEQCSRLFQAFSQADGSTTRQFGGTGLGLSISKRLVEIMGGEIGVASEPGRGSTFTFSACFELEQADEKQYPRLPEELKGARVLVVDDSPTSVAIVCDQLAPLPMRVESAGSGREALAAVLAADAGDPYRLLLMDWQMPEIDGIEATRRLKTLPLASPPVVLLITSFGGEAERALALEAGATEFLHKPFTTDSLAAEISRVFSCRQPPQPLPEKPAPRPKPFDFTGRRILLVDDNEVNRQLVADLLTGLGGTVEAVGDGGSAVEKVLTAAPAYDLVLMDVQMPRMDGYQATRAIRADGRYGALPIIALTAHALVDEQDKALSAGMDDFITKPVDLRAMLATIGSHLERSKTGSPAAGAA